DGPVLAVMPVDSVGEAIELANDGDYGLGASVWTEDRYQAQRIARELRAGVVWLDDHLPSPMISRGPWGAAAGGGLGKTLGAAGLRACAQEKLISWDPPAARGLWWGPYDGITTRAAQAVARMGSAREADRSAAWREVPGPALPGGGRRRRRAGEVRWPARLRRRCDAARPACARGSGRLRGRGLDPLGAAPLRRCGGSRGRVSGDRRHR